MNVAPEHQPRIRGQLPSNGGLARSYLVFHLWPGGTASRYKQWPLERWIKLAEHFIRAGFTIVFTGSPPQQSANDAVIAALNPELRGLALNQAGLSLAGTCALISGASLVVSVDTGAMHLAAALEAPTLALMGPACRRRWGPVSDSARVLESPLDGCCYLNLGFEVPRRPPKCMEAIAFETVRARCEEILAAGAAGQPAKVSRGPSAAAAR